MRPVHPGLQPAQGIRSIDVVGTEFRVTREDGRVFGGVRFGDKPWKTAPDGRSPKDHHEACMRLLGADSCGDGTPHTLDGTLIGVFDRSGIQTDEPFSGARFEAARSPAGAVCVAEPRLTDPAVADPLGELVRTCPRLAGKVGAGCVEEEALRHPDALLFNRSR